MKVIIPRNETIYNYKTYPKLYLRRFGFLTRPINCILTWLKAYEETAIHQTHYVEIDVESLHHAIIDLANSYRRCTGRRLKTVIIGYKHWHNWVMNPESLTQLYLNNPNRFEIAGIRIIPSAHTEEIIPVEFD